MATKQKTDGKPEHKYERVDTESLIPYARNARLHSPEQVNKVAGSIKEFGFINPVIIDKDNGIIAGHCRVLAANKLDLKQVPCIRVEHLTETQKKAYILADNQLALKSEWDEEMLKLELQELKELDFDLEMIGFEDFKDDDFEFEPKDKNESELKLVIKITCKSEDEQQELFEELNSRGYKVSV